MSLPNLPRIGQIVRVLVKYGLGDAVHELGLGWHLPFFARFRLHTSEFPLPVRLRMAMEELGGAFIKLGQVLSIRPDLVPQEYCEEFAKLLDEVPSETSATIHHVIEEEFHQPVKKLFDSLDPKPLGSASVAQVHLAKLHNGKHVVVKIQRPNARAQFAADIEIMRYLANKLERKLGRRIISPKLIVEEFERYTQHELNFLSEAKDLDQFRLALKGFPRVKIPEVHWPLTSKRVLTMEYLEGRKLSELDHFKPRIDKRQVAHALVDSAVHQIFDAGLFHADLHPGNILVLPNGKLGLLDFGITGRIDRTMRKKGLELYLALVQKDIPAITNVLLTYGTPSVDTDLEAFQTEVARLVNTFYGESLKEARITHLMHQLFIACSRYHISLPTETILLGKALVTVEATARMLDPRFDFVTYSQPKITALLRKEKTPTRVLKRFVMRTRTLSEALASLPEETLTVVHQLKSGQIAFNLRDAEFRHLGTDLNRSSNRLSYALLSAALILSSALFVRVGPQVAGYSVFSVVTAGLAVFFLFPLFISIIHEGKANFDPHPEKIYNRR